MSRRPPDPVVHLELHTPNLPRACGFYGELLGWSTDVVRVASGAYVGLGLGERVDGGIVESEREPPRWIPYVETARIEAARQRAERLGALSAGPIHEGAAGWWCTIRGPEGSTVAIWEPKPSRR